LNVVIERPQCDNCGRTTDSWYTDEASHFCPDCFPKMMDSIYGKGNWRPTDTEGVFGGFFEYWDDVAKLWLDSGFFYTDST